MELTNALPTGLIGLALAVVIYFAVIVAKRAGLVITGDHARLANVLLSAFFSLNLQGLDDLERGLVGLLASLGSALIHELYKYLTAPKTESVG